MSFRPRHPRVERPTEPAIVLDRQSAFDAWIERWGVITLGLIGCALFAMAMPHWFERAFAPAAIEELAPTEPGSAVVEIAGPPLAPNQHGAAWQE